MAGMIVVVFLFSAFIWNILMKSGNYRDVAITAISLVLILGAGIWLFFLVYNLSDRFRFIQQLESVRNEERSKVLNKIEKLKSEEPAETKEKADVRAIYDKLIPDSKKVKNLEDLTKALFINLSNEAEIVQGLCYVNIKGTFSVAGKYAFTGEHTPADFKSGETLPGQAVADRTVMVVDNIPETYFNVESGLGKSLPKSLAFVPITKDKKIIALLELAGFKPFDGIILEIFNTMKDEMGELFSKFIKK